MPAEAAPAAPVLAVSTVSWERSLHAAAAVNARTKMPRLGSPRFMSEIRVNGDWT
jgi:hypothetical protein